MPHSRQSLLQLLCVTPLRRGDIASLVQHAWGLWPSEVSALTGLRPARDGNPKSDFLWVRVEPEKPTQGFLRQKKRSIHLKNLGWFSSDPGISTWENFAMFSYNFVWSNQGLPCSADLQESAHERPTRKRGPVTHGLWRCLCEFGKTVV